MSEQISSSDKPITLDDWHIIYQRLLPYLGGNKAVDGNPIGTVIAFPISTPPAGYLVCDGSKLSVTAFPLLFDVLKNAPASQRATWGDADWVTEFNVPDYRGEFPRFYGTNSHTNQGNGGAVGEHQDATEIPNFGYYHQNGTTTPYAYLGDVPNKNTAPTSSVNIQGKNVDKSKAPLGTGETAKIPIDSTYTAANTGVFTIRPTNTSFLPCIKYTYVTQEVEYSPEERVVGVWKETVDGVLKQKPLYQKTIDTGITTVIAKNQWVTLGTTSNVDLLVSANSSRKSEARTESGEMIYRVSSDNVQAYTTNDFCIPSFVTIRYTKTTDEWQPHNT